MGRGAIGSKIYHAGESPTYPLGFGSSFAATIFGAMIPASIHWILLHRENKRLDSIDTLALSGMLREMDEDSSLLDSLCDCLSNVWRNLILNINHYANSILVGFVSNLKPQISNFFRKLAFST